MTRVYNEPVDFKEESLAGFASAYGRFVERVTSASGFVRAGGPIAGHVSLVVGGGSGHYPSYGGIVGPGFATGGVLGDVFASPSTEQITRVARAAHGGAGVVLAFGNYAGDRLNFAAAQERLVAEGIDTRIVYVTDDIASGPADATDLRRGIAGTFFVYKVGGAAAERGDALSEVERLMRKANEATRSYGVAFAGCTLPGRDEPLFTVDRAVVEFGLGIHGEPGVTTKSWVPSKALARELVTALLVERPSGAERAAVIVNGLGATKYEELFLLYGDVAAELANADVIPVLPEVGELVTSLDMAGCSVSLMWLDQELEELWCAPADTVSFRRGTPVASGPRITVPADHSVAAAVVVTSASEASVRAARAARLALVAMAMSVIEAADELGALDAVAGDGDHGIGMTRGMRAAATVAQDADDAMGVGTLLTTAGAAFGDAAGGTSGMLWGVLLTNVGLTLGDEDAVTAERLAKAVQAGAQAVQRAGGADIGDKTLLDVLLPFTADFTTGVTDGAALAAAWARAARRSAGLAEATADLVARVGRARPLAERGRGTPDPGAVSMAIALHAVGEALGSASRTQDSTTQGENT